MVAAEQKRKERKEKVEAQRREEIRVLKRQSMTNMSSTLKMITYVQLKCLRHVVVQNHCS